MQKRHSPKNPKTRHYIDLLLNGSILKYMLGTTLYPLLFCTSPLGLLGTMFVFKNNFIFLEVYFRTYIISLNVELFCRCIYGRISVIHFQNKFLINSCQTLFSSLILYFFIFHSPKSPEPQKSFFHQTCFFPLEFDSEHQLQ